ncbi:MAG: BrnT family toxin [Pyrinomonadaceae bacterium]
MFDWDIDKAILNFEKHGVSFEEASTAFDDENGLDWADPKHSKGESRRKRLAESGIGRLLLVVYTKRKQKNGNETIRIISSRAASYNERRRYFEL